MDGSITVLHVEDDPSFAELTATYLERESGAITVEVAGNASEGLDQLSEDVDCILSDYDMPGMDGLEFLESVREQRPDLPFILFTGEGSEAVASEAISAGVTDYIQKETGPEQYAVVANRIVNAVEQVRAERRLEAEQTRAKTLFEQIPTPIVEVSDDGDTPLVEAVNPQFERTFGYSAAEIVGNPLAEYIIPDRVEEGADVGAQIRSGDLDAPREVTRQTVDGERKFLLQVAQYAETHGHVLIYTDITERKEREEKLIRLRSYTQQLMYAETASETADIALRAVDEILGVDLGAVFTPSETQEGVLELVEVLNRSRMEKMYGGLPAFLRDAPAGTHSDLAWEVFETGQPVFINDTAESDRIARKSPFGSLMMYPIGRHGIVLLAATALEAFTETEEILLDLLANALKTGFDRLEWERELRQQRNELERQNDLFQRAQSLASVGAWEADADTGELLMSDEAVRIFGIQDDDGFTTEDASTYFHPDDRPVIDDAYTSAYYDGESFEHVLRLVRDDGEKRWIKLTGEPQFGDDDTVDSIRGTFQDITGQKQREQRLETLHEATRELVSAETKSKIGEITTTVAGDVLDLPLNGFYLYDGSEDALVPIAYTEQTQEILGETPVFDRGDGIAWRVFESGSTAVFEDVQTAEDRLNPNTPIRSEMIFPLGNHGVLMIGSRTPADFDDTDVMLAKILAANVETALDRAEREWELEARTRELEQKTERLDQFASIVSHDLRNPLQVADGQVTLAREQFDSEHLDGASRALSRMENLIESVLTWARHGGDATDLEPFSVADVSQSAWSIIQSEEATLTLDVEKTIDANRSQLSQLLENLFRNAIDHGGDDVAITVGDLDTGFYVEDDGPGIPPDERDDVFDPGYTTEHDGSGFGLSIVKQVVDAHDWEITVTNGDDGGARFEITGVTQTELESRAT